MKSLDIPGAGVGVEASQHPRTKTDLTSGMKRSGSDEEVFTTPPTTPSLLPTINPHSPASSDQFRDDEMTDIFYEQIDMIDIPSTTEIEKKKRQAHDREPSPLSRKVAKGCGYPQLPQAYQVRHLVPAKPSQRFPPSLSNSFSTTTSGSTRASFSTSFGTESTSTSFGPFASNEKSEIHYPVIPNKSHCVESKSTVPKLDSLDTSKMERTTSDSLAAPNLTVFIDRVPLHEYLQKHLTEESPLCK